MRAAYLVSALLLLVPSAGRGQAQQDLSAPLPLDIAIRTGTLPNGLTFFIRHNALPNDRVMLRLVVKAGSIDEADDQRGLAHMLEHMAFNGTAHFKPGELVSYLESIGAQFGAHVNAYTSFDETVFMLNVPTEKPGVLERGFEALSDFASGLTLDPGEIDRERGVVIEEWRGRLGAGTRLQEPQMKAMFGASRYIDRIPIGLPDTLKTFSPQRLRDFYTQFYRPDRMAVIVVGDIEVAKAEATTSRACRRGRRRRDRSMRFRIIRTRATSRSPIPNCRHRRSPSCTSIRCASCGRWATIAARWPKVWSSR
jgi:zinc protease